MLGRLSPAGFLITVGRVPDPSQLPHLLRLLDDDSSVVRVSVAEALRAFGPSLTQELAHLTEPPDAAQVQKIRDLLSEGSDAGGEVMAKAEEDLELADGEVRVMGAPGLSISIREVAEAASGVPGYSLPGNIEPGMEASAHFTPTALTYSNGVHAVEVEVDVETGEVTIQRYVALSDSGRMINPMMVDGQIQGGVVHGIGNGLFEHMRYDELGQPLTTNLADYLLPTATELPNIDVIHHVSPSPLNPLGVKGVGECGTIPAAAAIVSAVGSRSNMLATVRILGVLSCFMSHCPIRLIP